uniref:Major facilitator superfamily (MFS) profile domain-containing protein n=1 Tax=Attheya septentrionalis TaxID=420275 RepID=A0A7S2UFY0_9STRA|mmetsp:Transcript_23727/g.42807  ORF Transcript_23727/g.42807 Transcript_23727/m.42807 type:complete len:503 (+) Transcript_23727:310-1818(+)
MSGEESRSGDDRFTHKASPASRFDQYDLLVDPETNDRAVQMKIFSWKRPHMRALHCAWISFFLAFTVWFCVSPLLSEIRHDLDLSTKEVWTSSICSDVTTIITRFLVGSLCDKYGARIPMGVVLMLSAIPAACTGLVNSALGLSFQRLFLGIAGSSFVMAQYWPTCMFVNETAGTVNGLVGGWGNLGGAFTQVLMGTLLFPFFRDYVYDGDSEMSWRTICIIPAFFAFVWGLIVLFISDDAPQGYYSEMRRRGTMDIIYMTKSLQSGTMDSNVWILYVQYACCFGVELIMNNAAVLYFVDEFAQTTEQAAALASTFGWMNLFARLLGGWLSDHFNLKAGMRGRLWLQAICLVGEASLIIVFAYTRSLVGAVVTMCAFSIFTQCAEGAIYGVVPYVNPKYTGTIAGIVGGGGNLGGVVFGFGFRSLSYTAAFLMMGSLVLVSSFLTFFIRIPGHRSMLGGKDSAEIIGARERYLRNMKPKEVDSGTNASSIGNEMNDTNVGEA